MTQEKEYLYKVEWTGLVSSCSIEIKYEYAFDTFIVCLTTNSGECYHLSDSFKYLAHASKWIRENVFTNRQDDNYKSYSASKSFIYMHLCVKRPYKRNLVTWVAR